MSDEDTRVKRYKKLSNPVAKILKEDKRFRPKIVKSTKKTKLKIRPQDVHKYLDEEEN